MSDPRIPTARNGVLLVASSGGHLLELVQLADVFSQHERCWVTFDKADARGLLEREQVVFAYHPTNRHVLNLVRNMVLALRLVRRLRPRAVISTGAGVGVPFCYAGRLLGSRVIYVESLARISALSLSGRLIYPVAHRFFVQAPELARRRTRAEYRGAVFDLR